MALAHALDRFLFRVNSTYFQGHYETFSSVVSDVQSDVDSDVGYVASRKHKVRWPPRTDSGIPCAAFW
jgi:hypothetical protein